MYAKKGIIYQPLQGFEDINELPISYGVTYRHMSGEACIKELVPTECYDDLCIDVFNVLGDCSLSETRGWYSVESYVQSDVGRSVNLHKVDIGKLELQLSLWIYIASNQVVSECQVFVYCI